MLLSKQQTLALCWVNVGLRRMWWINVNPALVQWLVFSGRMTSLEHVKKFHHWKHINTYDSNAVIMLFITILFRYRLLTEKWASMNYSQKWNESGFRPPLCTFGLIWARRTSWGWWDEWDDTVLQTQDLKFEPWRSDVEHDITRSRRLPTILSFTRGWGRNIFNSELFTNKTGTFKFDDNDLYG